MNFIEVATVEKITIRDDNGKIVKVDDVWQAAWQPGTDRYINVRHIVQLEVFSDQWTEGPLVKIYLTSKAERMHNTDVVVTSESIYTLMGRIAETCTQ